MSHHGFRRDIARFSVALENVARGDASKVEPLREEWRNYRATLHGHHEAEDAGVFPAVRNEHASVGSIIDRLVADHRRIDPILERGDRAFAALPEVEDARGVVGELAELLDAHLALEEAEVIPFLRDAKAFPPPATDAEAELYAMGFAWSSQGVAPEVLQRVYEMLPENLTSRLAAARAAFDARCARVWGATSPTASRTTVPGR
jgi:hemerythrin-like domain-containing protein